MRFRSKLYVGFGTILLVILIMAVVGFIRMNQLQANMNLIVHDKYAGVKHATIFRKEINSISREIGHALLDSNDGNVEKYAKSVIASNIIVSSEWSLLQSHSVRLENPELMAKLNSEYTQYGRTLEELGKLLQSGQRSAAIAYYHTQTEPIREVLFATLQAFTDLYEKEMEQSLAESMNMYYSTMRLGGVLISLVLLISVSVAVWVFLSVTRNLKRIGVHMKQVALMDGSMPRIPIQTADEIGVIAETFNDMAEALEQKAAKEKEYQLALEERNRHQAVLAEYNELLRGVQELEPLSQQFLNHAAPLMSAGYAALYVRAASGSSSGAMKRVALYGGTFSAAASKEAEGLVAQCAAQNRTLQLTEIPTDYIRIQSGLGSASPAYITLIPIPYEGQSIAVLEFATFQVPSTAVLAVIDEARWSLGMALHGAAAYLKVQELLKESQAFAEELQTQSEELQSQQEELRTLNEELEELYQNSEQRNAELECIKSELEEKNRQIVVSTRYKTEFLANISHELRTPLNSLLLLSQLLYQNKEENLNPKQVEYIKTIHNSGMVLLQLINDILDLSKIESGKMEIMREKASVREIGNVLQQQFQPLALQKQLDFHIDYEEGADQAELYTDIYKLQQILRNLLSNALKFTEAGSVSLVFRTALSIQGEPSLEVAVRDTGIGIAQDKQVIIFEMFQQADGTTSRKYGGTGLGLSISKELAALLGGEIRVTSEEGMGSTFTLVIPLGVGAQLPAASPAFPEVASAAAPAFVLNPKDLDAARQPEEGLTSAPATPLNGAKILLVDDDMRNIFSMVGVLESCGMEVIFAENGMECLDLLEQNTGIDLILMDIMMPKMDGYETIRRIREGNASFRDIPIIALTAKAMKNDRSKCIEAGANDYISKPVQLEQLFSLLRVWLHKEEL
jgi:two-component system, chemotaxis family, sensor kinase CheA